MGGDGGLKGLSDVRRRPRGSIGATAFLSIEGGARITRMGPLQVENVSAGGALLTGGSAVAAGTLVQVELSIPGHPSLRVAGTVVRLQDSGKDRSAVAVAFRDVASDVEDLIQQAVVDALEGARRLSAPAVLVIDDSADNRPELHRDLEVLGQRTVRAKTPLDALRWLQDQHSRVEVVLIGLQFGHARGLEVLAFLAAHFPQVRRVLMSREADAAQLEEARAAGTAHAILLEPWDSEQLTRALGRASR